MTAGRMRSRMMVQGRGRVWDDAGGWREEWVDYGYRWVAYRPMSRSERMVAMGEDLQVSGTVSLRWERGMPRPIRCVDDWRILEQVGGRVRKDDKRKLYEVDVKEVQDDVFVAEEEES